MNTEQTSKNIILHVQFLCPRKVITRQVNERYYLQSVMVLKQT